MRRVEICPAIAFLIRELLVVFILSCTTDKNNLINPAFLNLVAEQDLKAVIISLEIIVG